MSMDRVTRCLHCGKRMVPAPSLNGRTELICVYCDQPDSVEMAEAKKWADMAQHQPAAHSQKAPPSLRAEQRNP
jgi:hypothetical protein